MDERIKAFAKLGEVLRTYKTAQNEEYKEFYTSNWIRLYKKQKPIIHGLLLRIFYFAIHSIGESLKMRIWINGWHHTRKESRSCEKPQKVAVIMAGNIPLVGFHDFLKCYDVR